MGINSGFKGLNWYL